MNTKHSLIRQRQDSDIMIYTYIYSLKKMTRLSVKGGGVELATTFGYYAEGLLLRTEYLCCNCSSITYYSDL